MAALPASWPQADVAAGSVDAAGAETTQSLYTSAAWLGAKKQGPPPIFTTIGFRHPHCVEFDILLRDQTRTEDLLSVVKAELRRFDAGNVVIALAALPKLVGPQGLEPFQRHPSWAELQDRVRLCVHRLEPRGISMVLYSMARLHWHDSELLASLTAGAEKHMADLGATDVAKVSWSLAKLGVYDRVRGLWAALAKEGARKCCSGSFIDISMTAWAFVSVGFPDKALFGQLATAATDRREELPPQTISNLAWAFAKGRIKNEQLFDVLADRSIKCANEFDRQGVANTLWAFATLGIRREDVFEALVKFTLETSLWRRFTPQMASNVLWACSRAGITDVRLFDSFAEYIREHSHSFDNQNISNCAWAYAVAELPSKPVFATLAEAALKRLARFRLDELCGLLWAFTRGKAADSPIFEDAIGILIPRARELDSQGLSNLIWITATVGHLRGSPVPGARELVDSLLAQILDLHVRLDSEGAAMVVWALWRQGRFHDAWTLYVRVLSDGRHPAIGKTWKANAADGRQQYWVTLLMEAERRGDVTKQVYLWKQMAADTFVRSLRTAFMNCALMALIGRGLKEEALELLAQLVRTKLGNVVTVCLARRLGVEAEEVEPSESIENVLRRRPQQASRYEDFHHREAAVLLAVLQTVQPGDARAVRAMVEEMVFRDGGRLKVSGGEKTCVLDNALQRHCPKLVLEYGAYVGYTTIGIALQAQSWGGRVVSLEMDPLNAAIARNMVELAGLSSVAKVQLGHSDDSAPIILEEYGEGSVGMVFMDQRGTRFHADLQRMEALGLLADPCVVIADNALNPGAPLHVWRVCSMPHYSTDIIGARKFGAHQSPDWVTISVARPGPSYGKEPQEQPELISLARGTDRFRWRTKATPAKDMAGDPTDEHTRCFLEAFERFGIRPNLAVATSPDGDCGAASWLVQLGPGEVMSQRDRPLSSERLKGGHWRSIIGDPLPLDHNGSY